MDVVEYIYFIAFPVMNFLLSYKFIIKTITCAWKRLIYPNSNPTPPKTPPSDEVGGSDVAGLLLNCKITERLVLIDPGFKSYILPTTPHKRSR